MLDLITRLDSLFKMAFNLWDKIMDSDKGCLRGKEHGVKSCFFSFNLVLESISRLLK